MKKEIIIVLIVYLIVIFGAIAVYKYSSDETEQSTTKQYYNSDFGIETYISSVDKDNDGIDDQTDILNNVKKYIETKPKYESKYYSTG